MPPSLVPGLLSDNRAPRLCHRRTPMAARPSPGHHRAAACPDHLLRGELDCPGCVGAQPSSQRQCPAILPVPAARMEASRRSRRRIFLSRPRGRRRARGGAHSHGISCLSALARAGDDFFSLILSLSYVDSCRKAIDVHCGCPKASATAHCILWCSVIAL